MSGCSTKTEINKSDIQKDTAFKNQSNDDLEEDEFLNEFEDEMAIETKFDPFSGYNRMMTSFNDGAYEYVLAPTAKGYRYIVHKEIRSSVDNFFHNILFPVRFVNNLLQGKLINTAEETGRFLINSTIGILGLFDPAKSYFELEAHNEDFGQTLGFYGVGAGPHIVLPFFGPSNLRDAISMYPDSLLSPVDYQESRSYNLTKHYGESLVLNAYDKINGVSLNPEQYSKIKKDAIDLYPFLRDIYEQLRETEIKE